VVEEEEAGKYNVAYDLWRKANNNNISIIPGRTPE